MRSKASPWGRSEVIPRHSRLGAGKQETPGDCKVSRENILSGGALDVQTRRINKYQAFDSRWVADYGYLHALRKRASIAAMMLGAGIVPYAF